MRAGQQRLFLGLGATLVAVLALLQFTEPPTPRSDGADEAAPAEVLFEGRQPDSVVRVEFVRRDASRVVLARAGASWKLEAPVEGLADHQTAEDLASRLIGLRVQAPVLVPPESDDPSTREPFGLGEPPRASVVVEFAEGDRVALRFGDDTPVGYGTYLQFGEASEVRPANGHLAALFEEPTGAYRDNRVWHLDPEAVSTLRWPADEGLNVLAREADSWTYNATASPDEEAVLALLRSLADVRIAAFDVDEPESTGSIEATSGDIETVLQLSADGAVVRSPLHDTWVRLEADLGALMRSFQDG